MSWSYLYVFFQSSCIEVVLYYFAYSKSLSWKKVFLMTTFANAITHPVVFFGFMQSSLPYLWAILLAEVFAVFGETVLHSLTSVKPLFRTVGPATLANLVSWQLAPILTYFLIFN